RSPGERANAQLKTWKILSKLRCCPWRAGQPGKAIHVLQAREAKRRLKMAQWLWSRYGRPAGEICSIGTPASESSETKLCRSSRGVQSAGFRPAASVTLRKERRTCEASAGV